MAISLEKRTENATNSLISLLKKEADKGNDLGDLTAQVILAIDYSVSMRGRYASQEVQELVERALALSLSGLDDDGNIQVFFFDSKSYRPEVVSQSNYSGFVNAWASRHDMGGTDYLPVIKDIRKFISDNDMVSADKPPVFVIFVTDGETRNEGKISRELIDAASDPVFWQFMGLGYSPKFLKRLNTMGGRVIDNVGLFEVRNSQAMSDDEFYQKTISEFFSEWLPAARQQNITNA